MANEAEWTYATQVTLEASGTSAANAAFAAADDTTLASAGHSNYPYADFVLKTVGFSATLGSSKYIGLYRRALNADTASGDAVAPGTSNKVQYVGAFTIPDVQASTGTTYFTLEDVPIIEDQEFWIENQTGVTVNAGWTLKVRPKTLVPGA